MAVEKHGGPRLPSSKPMDEGNAPDVPCGPQLIRFGSWNVRSMTGKSSEVVEVLERQRADVC